jgi:cytochrome c2
VAARSWLRLLLVSLVGALFIACTTVAPDTERAKPASRGTLSEPSRANVSAVSAKGNAERGHELVQRFECNRCHEGTGLGTAALAKNCFSCHEQIISGTFPVSAAALARFRPHVASAREAPSLVALGARLEPRWVIEYLLSPHDLRPRLTPTMPRLALDSEEARDIVAYLMEGSPSSAPLSVVPGSASRGRELMDSKGCSSCHAFTGVPPFTQVIARDSGSARAAALAPDLRFTRERVARARLIAWLMDPTAIKPDTRMPNFGLSQQEAADIAAYLLEAPLSPQPVATLLRLPLLTRRVSFDEANRQVFSRTCHHCHTDANSAGGDGGPGNTGGFGFAPRGVSFASHASILAGYVDDKGQRRSLFEPMADGTPRLVAALLARHDEARGAPRSAVRGMPLGLPPVSAEDIQLVESWVAQGKPL